MPAGESEQLQDGKIAQQPEVAEGDPPGTQARPAIARGLRCAFHAAVAGLLRQLFSVRDAGWPKLASGRRQHGQRPTVRCVGFFQRRQMTLNPLLQRAVRPASLAILDYSDPDAR